MLLPGAMTWGCASDDPQRPLGDRSAQWGSIQTQQEQATDPSPTSKEAQVALLEGFVPPQPQVLSERPFESSDPSDPPTQPFGVSGNISVPSDAPGTLSDQVVFVDFERGVEQRIRLGKEEILRVGVELAERGIHEPVRGGDAGEPEPGEALPEMTTKGLSSGIDNRQWHGLWPPWPNTTVGKVHARGGTGTLVGRRVVLTCAHCVINENTNQYMPEPYYFAPREGAGVSPWGALEVQAFFVGTYLASGCTSPDANWAVCRPEDWALLVLKDEFPLGHPGWLGYADLSLQDALNAPNKRSPGYPSCGFPNSPNVGSTDCRNCSNPSATLCEINNAGGFQWGQPSSCSLGGYVYSNQVFTHGCDTSKGHSGGPVFYSQNGVYVIGANSAEGCDTCGGYPPILNPNYARRVDYFLFSWISLVKAMYP